MKGHSAVGTSLHATYTVYMVENIRDERSEPPTRQGRQALADDLLTELTSWGPRDREGLFKAWQHGALSLIHLNVLSVLEAEGPLPMSRLAQALDVSDASATGIVDRMERRGLVAREHAKDDRRLVLVHRTDAAGDVFSSLQAHRREHLARLLQELSDDELGCFLIGLRAMRTARVRLRAAAEAEGAVSPNAACPIAPAAEDSTSSSPTVTPAPTPVPSA